MGKKQMNYLMGEWETQISSNNTTKANIARSFCLSQWYASAYSTCTQKKQLSAGHQFSLVLLNCTKPISAVHRMEWLKLPQIQWRQSVLKQSYLPTPIPFPSFPLPSSSPLQNPGGHDHLNPLEWRHCPNGAYVSDVVLGKFPDYSVSFRVILLVVFQTGM